MRLRDFFLLFILISSSLTISDREIVESFLTYTKDVNDSENLTFLTELSIVSVEENYSGVIGSISNDKVLVTLLDGTLTADLRWDVDENGSYIGNVTSLTAEIHFYDVNNYSNVTKIHIRSFETWVSRESSSIVWDYDKIAVSLSFKENLWIAGEKTHCFLVQDYCGAIILFNQSGEVFDIKTYSMRPTLLQTDDGGAIWGLTGSYFSPNSYDPFNPGNISVGSVRENESFINTNISTYLFTSKSKLLSSGNGSLIFDHITINPGEWGNHCGLSFAERALVIVNSSDIGDCKLPVPFNHESVVTIDESNQITVFEGKSIINSESGNNDLILTVGRLENESRLDRIGNITFPNMRSVVKGCALNDGSSFILLISNDRTEGDRPILRNVNQSIIYFKLDEENRSIHISSLVDVYISEGRRKVIEEGIQFTECYSDLLRFSIIDGSGFLYTMWRHHERLNDEYDGRYSVTANVSIPSTGYSFNFSAPSVFFELRNYSEIPTERIEFDPVYIPTVNQSNPDSNNSDKLSTEGTNSSTSDRENETSVAENNSVPIGTETEENDLTSIENNEMADCLDDNSNEFEYPNDCDNGNSSGLDVDEALVNGEGESTPSIEVYQIDERKAILAGVGFVATFILVVLLLKKLVK